ncbi:MAG: circularly permuted type 2 ATP-grasp protein [Oleibacter sp.]|nr:circularly permuted type 2 ATP-grasp protein [Thalassolituus sp.]
MINANQSQSQTVNLEYPPVPGGGDVVRDADGKLLQHWQYILDSLAAMPGEALTERQAKILRLLRDDGATYNVYSDQESTPGRIWGLDMVPHVISSEQWGDVESGLLERAEVLNLLLRDLYGPRHLVRTGVIPSEVLFSFRGFLRACHGIRMPGEHELIIHSVDMIRMPSGEMCVLADRTQAPSGAGYALENRTVMSRVMPSLFRDSHVHRLAGYFQQLRAKLIGLCPSQANPRVAILTPGPRNESYFEHAYLANYLGFYLVQSDDLLVRNGYLWMKSLDGLNRVDVLWRRVDDWFCDPVELRSDSRLGVAGMLEVIRAGNLVVANPLGSGVLENPVLMKYMPAISKALVGRELRLKSVTNYWCGDSTDRKYVLDNMDSLVIKPINRKPGQISTSGPSSTAEVLAQLRDEIKRHPENFVAQPILPASYLPTFDGNKLKPRPAILRSFAVAGTSSYSVMPGGLTRVGMDEQSFLISSQAGAVSKDTWIVASEPERATTNLPVSDDKPARETELINLPSRVLENLYWMGRYAERAEASLRILRTSYRLLNGEEPLTPVIRTYLMQAVADVTSTVTGALPINDQEMGKLLRTGPAPQAISGMLTSLLFCADEAKELLSSDTYRVINDIRDLIPELSQEQRKDIRTPDEVLDPLVTALMALSGLNHESMTRGYGWRFMELGRRIERAAQSAELVSCLLTPVVGNFEQARLTEALLQSMEGLISYRRRYGARTSVQTALDMALLDPDNPRAIIYQLDQMLLQIRKLPKGSRYLHELPPAERVLVDATTQIRLTSLKTLCADNGEGEREQLSSVMKQLNTALMEASDLLSDRYFDHREHSQQLVSSQWENN